jgi:hypothetical protein
MSKFECDKSDLAPGSVNLTPVVVIPLLNLSKTSIMRATNNPKQIKYEKNFNILIQRWENLINFIVNLHCFFNNYYSIVCRILLLSTDSKHN